MEIENYFGISIPDAEAEKIYTVQLMVDSVASHLHIKDDSLELRDRVFQQVVQSFQALGWTREVIQLSDLVSAYVPSNEKRVWGDLENSLHLLIPEIPPTNNGNTRIIDKVKKLVNLPPAEKDDITMSRFVDAICANNYDFLIDKKNIKTTYEIYTAVSGITVEKIGVDYYEMAPGKSFGSDLGID
ncbi:MAG: hypothetical protein JWQ27_2166 [Ferruginibacter sp.]|nr:hypothetical protein [Ferruginibacter sp.]